MGRSVRGIFIDFRGHAVPAAFRSARFVSIIAAVGLAGCASMGPAGATRFDAARALGLSPSDVIVLSRDYELTGSGADQLALSNYTIKTRSDQTYTCTLVPASPSASLTDPGARSVCVPKD